MVLELVKEYDNAGQVIYYIKIDDKFQSGTVRHHIHDAMELYNRVKENYSKARTETIIREVID